MINMTTNKSATDHHIKDSIYVSSHLMRGHSMVISATSTQCNPKSSFPMMKINKHNYLSLGRLHLFQSTEEMITEEDLTKSMLQDMFEKSKLQLLPINWEHHILMWGRSFECVRIQTKQHACHFKCVWTLHLVEF